MEARRPAPQRHAKVFLFESPQCAACRRLQSAERCTKCIYVITDERRLSVERPGTTKGDVVWGTNTRRDGRSVTGGA